MISKEYRNIILCPQCGSSIMSDLSACEQHHILRKDGDTLIMAESSFKKLTDKKDFLYKIKSLVKPYPDLYNFLTDVLSLNIFWRRRAKEFLASFPGNALIVDVGGGTRKTRHNAIVVDIVATPRVDIVASAYRLPFKDGSVDGVVSEMVLEHLDQPKLFIDEAYRILKPGGSLYVSTVFIYPYHDAPGDFHRWTKSGLSSLLARSGFAITREAIYLGPIDAWLTVTQSLLATLLSFGVKPLKSIWFLFFFVVLWPLRFLDLIVMQLPGASDEAGGFYVIGKK